MKWIKIDLKPNNDRDLLLITRSKDINGRYNYDLDIGSCSTNENRWYAYIGPESEVIRWAEIPEFPDDLEES